MKHQFVEKKTDRGLTNRGSRGDYAAQLRPLLDVELQHCCNPVEVLLPCTVLHMQGLNLVSFLWSRICLLSTLTQRQHIHWWIWIGQSSVSIFPIFPSIWKSLSIWFAELDKSVCFNYILPESSVVPPANPGLYSARTNPLPDDYL